MNIGQILDSIRSAIWEFVGKKRHLNRINEIEIAIGAVKESSEYVHRARGRNSASQYMIRNLEGSNFPHLDVFELVENTRVSCEQLSRYTSDLRRKTEPAETLNSNTIFLTGKRGEFARNLSEFSKNPTTEKLQEVKSQLDEVLEQYEKLQIALDDHMKDLRRQQQLLTDKLIK